MFSFFRHLLRIFLAAAALVATSAHSESPSVPARTELSVENWETEMFAKHAKAQLDRVVQCIRDPSLIGDEDVDFIDAMRVVANFAPSGYPLFGSLSTGDKLNVSSLIAGENGNGILDAGRMEPLGRGSDRPNTAEDGTAREPQSRYLVRASESSSEKSPSASQLLYLESIDRSFRRMGMRQGDSFVSQFRDFAM